MTTPPECNVAAQREDPGSVLTFTRHLIALRRANPDLHSGAYRSLPSPPDTWLWRRGDGFATALNLGTDTVAVEGVTGAIAIATDRDRDGQAVDGQVTLGPGEGALIRLG
jgi:glycosidase